MKKNSFPFLRIILYGVTFAGLLAIWVSLQSFETIASFLNNISRDGNFESFTVDRFQIIRIPLGVVGLCFAIISGVMLARWEKTKKYINLLSTQTRDFGSLFRQDAQVFWNDLRRAFGGLRWVDIAVLTGLIIAAIIARLYQLNAPLLADEAYTYSAFASKSLWQTISDYHLPNNHVLLSIMVNLLTHLFGNQVWLIRLPTMIAGVLMIPAAYVLGWRLYGRNAAVLSAAMIAVFPVLIMYSVWARGYGIVSLMTLLILILGDYVRKEKNRFAWFLLIIFSAAGFYSVPIMLFPFGALYTWLLLSCVFGDLGPYRSKLDFIKYWLIGGFASALLTLLLYAPILFTDSDRFFNNQFISPVNWDMLPTAFWNGVQDTWHEWTSSIPVWIVILGVLGLVVGLILHNRISSQKIPLQIAFLLWITAILLVRRPDMSPRLWLFLAAPLLIWSAGGLAGLLELISGAFRKNLYLAQGFVGIVAVSVFLINIVAIPKIPERWDQKGGTENLVLYLKDNLREGDLVNASNNSLSQIRYYFNVYDVPLGYIRRSGPFKRAFLALSRETDTLEKLAPVDGSNHSLIDLNTVRIILKLDGLTVYECYPTP